MEPKPRRRSRRLAEKRENRADREEEEEQEQEEQDEEEQKDKEKRAEVHVVPLRKKRKKLSASVLVPHTKDRRLESKEGAVFVPSDFVGASKQCLYYRRVSFNSVELSVGEFALLDSGGVSLGAGPSDEPFLAFVDRIFCVPSKVHWEEVEAMLAEEEKDKEEDGKEDGDVDVAEEGEEDVWESGWKCRLRCRWCYRSHEAIGSNGEYFDFGRLSRSEVMVSDHFNVNDVKFLLGKCSVTYTSCENAKESETFSKLCLNAEKNEFFCRYMYFHQSQSRVLVSRVPSVLHPIDGYAQTSWVDFLEQEESAPIRDSLSVPITPRQQQLSLSSDGNEVQAEELQGKLDAYVYQESRHCMRWLKDVRSGEFDAIIGSDSPSVHQDERNEDVNGDMSGEKEREEREEEIGGFDDDHPGAEDVDWISRVMEEEENAETTESSSLEKLRLLIHESKELQREKMPTLKRYDDAITSLQLTSLPDRLPCRHSEKRQILSFLLSHLEHGATGGCLYLHGMPGTGKTAVVLELIKMLQRSHELGEMAPFQYVHLNGVLFRDSPSKVYQHLYACMSHDHRFVTSQHAQRLLQSSMERASARRVSVVLLLDEMDQITQHSVIYNLVDWSRRPHSQLIFIGISNTMDLPERLLHSRIHSRLGLARVLFPPYTHDQLISILLSRLRDCVDVVEDGAVDLIARKVAAVSGDCRRALHLCTRAIEIARREFLENGRLDTCRMGMKHVDQALIDASMSARMLHDHIQKQPLLHRRVLAQIARAGIQKVLMREDLVKSVLVFCPVVVSCGNTSDGGYAGGEFGDDVGEERVSVKKVVGMEWREWIEQAIDRLEEQHFIALADASRQSLSEDDGDGSRKAVLMSEVEKRGMSRVRLCIDREEVCRALKDERDQGCMIPR